MPNEFPDFGLTPEERREAVFGHYYEWPGMDGEHGEIWEDLYDTLTAKEREREPRETLAEVKKRLGLGVSGD